MKLRNKKTGEIIDIYKGEITLHYNQGRKTIHFKRLEDLEEWEDYEEPKEYWCIRENGVVGKRPYPIIIECVEQENRDAMREIGNYFDTEEEVEKAVEKLKAWKRLRDKGFRFIDHTDFDDGNITIWGKFNKELDEQDVNLLFGGEE